MNELQSLVENVIQRLVSINVAVGELWERATKLGFNWVGRRTRKVRGVRSRRDPGTAHGFACAQEKQFGVVRLAEPGEDLEDADVPDPVNNEIVAWIETACRKNISAERFWVGTN
jgi:hypothetical protein